MRRVLYVGVALSIVIYALSVSFRIWFGESSLQYSFSARSNLLQTVIDNPLTGHFAEEERVPSDSIPDGKVLSQISRIYEYQAEIKKAQSRGNNKLVERYLKKSVSILSELLEHPGITSHPDFQEIYRTVVLEYERYFGEPAEGLALPRGEIFELRDSLFAALNEIEAPLLEDVVLPDFRSMESVIPMVVNRLVESSLAFLKKKPERHVNNWLSRAETYFPMIEQILLEEKAPDELKYLSLIESGLNPQARSWAGAAGMWQFMPATGRQYGLDADSWVDERLDPEKSTRAAARFLTDLHKQFGDWHIAIAAYNCGPGNINKAIRKLRGSSPGAKPSFWNLYKYLPAETRNYVPMYIAASLIGSNPQEYGITEIKAGPVYEYDLVNVPGQTGLALIAGHAGTTETVLRALNPELRKASVPPSKTGYAIRLPIGAYTRFASSASRLGDGANRPAVHVVQAGESLGSIAAYYGVTAEQLKDYNRLRSDEVREGQKLRIPPGKGGTLTIADAKPVRVRYGGRSHRPLGPIEPVPAIAEARPPQNSAETATPEASPPAGARAPEAAVKTVSDTPEKNPNGYVMYRVRKGDTLGNIAERYEVSVRDIKRWNGLYDDEIYVGQRLKIYTDGKPHDDRTVYAENRTNRRTTRPASTEPRREEYPREGNPPRPTERRTQRDETERIIEMGREMGKEIIRKRVGDVLGGRLPRL